MFRGRFQSNFQHKKEIPSRLPSCPENPLVILSSPNHFDVTPFKVMKNVEGYKQLLDKFLPLPLLIKTD